MTPSPRTAILTCSITWASTGKRLTKNMYGMGIGVFKAESAQDWRGYDDMDAGRRVQNLAPANYREDSELMRSLKLAVESICKRIALRRLSTGE